MNRSRSKLRRPLAFGFALAVLAPNALRAQQAPLRFDLRLWPEGAVLLTGAVLTLVPEFSKGQLPHATCAPCDASRLPRIDRGILGPVRPTAATASNATLLGTAFLGGLFLARSRPGEGSQVVREDLAVLTEALTITGAVTDWTKVLIRRPRPVLYGPDAAAEATPGNGLGFPSGHTSLSFAAAAAYTSILHRRGVASRHRTEIAVLFSAATATAVLRVVARKHFPTDVVAGAALGSAIGWLTPALHATFR